MVPKGTRAQTNRITSSPHGPYGMGYTCVTRVSFSLPLRRGKEKITKGFSKSYHSSDDFLQLGNLKTESPVIVDKHATVKVVSLPRALTARHVLKVL